MSDPENQDHIERIEDKLDQVLSILHGDGKAEMGMVQKVNIVWAVVFKGPLYVASIVIGAILTLVIQYLGGK